MAERNPVAFMTYLRRVDQHDHGRLTELRKRLEGEVQLYTGEENFAIFQDREDIRWGQQWRSRIENSVNDVTFLIPIITPGFFKSNSCRNEVELFLEREESVGRSDLILPIYYIDYPVFNDEERRRHDPLMAEIAKHQYEDWRDLRHESLTSAAIGRKLSKLAETLRDALDQRCPPAMPPSGIPLAVTEPQQRQTPDQAQPAEDAAAQAQEEGGAAASTATAKPEPPRLIVSPFHRGDYTTIAAAIKAAKPGTLIMVEPGLYQEGLVIDKPLEIVGQGTVDEVVIEVANKNVIVFQATMGRIANVTLRQLGGKFFAVAIARGRLDLEDCDITSQGLACVAIHGGADPRLRRNRIHDGKESGVFVYEQGRGTLEDNVIVANARSGVAIKDGGDPVLRRNRIHDSKRNGVYVYEQGRGMLEDNDIFDNAYSGVAIMTGGDPVLRRNRMYDGKVSGVLVGKNGRGTLEDNDIFANSFSGVQIREGGDPILRHNRIHNAKQSGVSVYDEGRGTLEDNEISANAHAGVEIRTGGHPVLRRNRITQNGYEAIWVHKGGGGTFEDNDLRDNERGPWDIAKECESKVTRRNNQE